MGWLAVVPMKRHSARVPGKNVRLLQGKPLFHWIFQALTRVDLVERIVLDTDSEEIAEMVGKSFPVEISIRPHELRGDFVPVNDLLAYILDAYPQPQRFLQTHATNPLLTAETIAKAIRLLESESEYDSLFSVTRLQTRLYDQEGRALNHDPARLLRTQDLPPIYEENSNLYLFSRESFVRTHARIGARPFLFEMDKLQALDIDEESDFLMAETLMAVGGKSRAACGAL